MGEVFIMNINKIKHAMILSDKLVKITLGYTSKMDKFFENDINKNNNKELYNLYLNYCNELKGLKK